MFGLGLVTYQATGEGFTFLAATGTEEEIKKTFGEYFSIGLEFKTVEDWNNLLKSNNNSHELNTFIENCPKSWDLLLKGFNPIINFKLHYNLC